MTRVTVFPYILPASEHVKVINWQQRLNDENIPLQEVLPHWDAGTVLYLSSSIDVNVGGIREDCHLVPGDLLRAVLLWHSPGTNLRGRGSYVNIDGASPSLPVNLTLTLPGGLLADKVKVEIQLVLANIGQSSFKLSPHRPGSILWREQKTISLEGVASRFPSELINFAESSWLPENAAWLLDWDDTDLNQPALKGLRLLLNTGNARIMRAVAEVLSNDEIIRDIIEFDVGRTMIVGSLENEAFVQNPDSYADGSIGSYVRRLLRTLFSNESWEGIINLYHQNRSRFECELQDRFRLFQEL